MQTVLVFTAGNGADNAETYLNHSEVGRQIELVASKLSESLAGTRTVRVEEITRVDELSPD